MADIHYKLLDNIPKTEKVAVLAIAVAALALFPLKTDKVMMKSFSRGLSIQTSKREPPRIAFNEILNLTLRSNQIQIPSGRSINLNDKVEQKFIERTVTLIRSKKITLEPTVVSRTEILRELRAAEAQNEVQKTLVAEKQQEDRSWIDQLSAPQKIRMLAAQDSSRVLDQDWKIPTWRDSLAEQLELANMKESTFRRSGSQQSAGPTLDSSPSVAQSTSVKSAATKSLLASGVAVQGQVILQQGLGLADGYIDIRYIKDRVAQAVGKIQLPTNKYSIEVPELTGQIKATLYTRQGLQLGEGRIRVSQIETGKIQTSTIEIIPTKNELAFSYHDFDRTLMSSAKAKDYGDRGVRGQTFIASLDMEAKMDDQGTARVENVVQDSWALVRTEAEGYAPTLSLIAGGEEKKNLIFREKFIKALLSIAKEQKTMSTVEETNSVIWGQAKMDGKPQAGIQIDVEFGEEYKPIYFNQFMLPDATLKATTENGYYAILHLPEDFYSLVATRGGQYFSHVNVLAEADTVFVADLLNTLAIEKTELKVFDAFNGSYEKAQVEVQSLVEPVAVDGAAEIYLPEISRLSLMKVIPADPKYMTQVQVYSDIESTLQAPLVEAAWINNLRIKRRVVDEPETTIIVGFVADENYEAYLPHIKNYSSLNIVYFDSEGNITDSGKAGGGFVMFNVSPGIHSVVTVAKGTNTTQIQVMPVDIGVASILQFHF